MGVTALQHRIAVGLFAGGRSPAPPWLDRGQVTPGWWGILAALLLYVLYEAIKYVILASQTLKSIPNSLGGYDGCFNLAICAVIARLFLLLAGNRSEPWSSWRKGVN